MGVMYASGFTSIVIIAISFIKSPWFYVYLFKVAVYWHAHVIN